MPRSLSARSTFWPAVSQGNSVASWNMNATLRPPVSIVPSVGVSRPEIRLSSVLLPHPLAPDDAQELPLGDVQVDVVQGRHAVVSATERLGDAANADGWARSGRFRPSQLGGGADAEASLHRRS